MPDSHQPQRRSPNATAAAKPEPWIPSAQRPPRQLLLCLGWCWPRNHSAHDPGALHRLGSGDRGWTCEPSDRLCHMARRVDIYPESCGEARSGPRAGGRSGQAPGNVSGSIFILRTSYSEGGAGGDRVSLAPGLGEQQRTELLGALH